jgi:hypothetical protein
VQVLKQGNKVRLRTVHRPSANQSSLINTPRQAEEPTKPKLKLRCSYIALCKKGRNAGGWVDEGEEESAARV